MCPRGCPRHTQKWLGGARRQPETRAGKLILGIWLAFLVATAPVQAQSTPSPAVGQTPGLTLASEANGGDYLLGSVKLSSSFSDNVLLSSVHPLSDLDYGVQPALTVAKTLGWLHMTWDFSPGLVKYQRINQRDRLTGAVVTDIEARPKERWTIRVRNNYMIRTNPPFDTFSSEPSSTFFVGEGGGTIIPLVNQTSEEGDATITYQPGPRTTLEASGYFRDYIYHPIPGVTDSEGLVNSKSEIGRLQYYRKVSPRFSLGASYSFQNIDFSFTNHSAGVRSHSVVGVGTLNITPTMQFQVFGGPELAQIHNQILLNFGIANVFLPVTENTVSGTGGAIFALHKDRNTLQLAGTREVSGGTGLTAAAQSNKVDFTFRRELASRWYGEISGQYALFTPVGPGSSGLDIRAMSVRAGLSHKFTERFSIEIQLSRGQQEQTSPTIRRHVNVDFGQISLKYQIKRPIG
jgi:hypothetical protein